MRFRDPAQFSYILWEQLPVATNLSEIQFLGYPEKQRYKLQS